MNNHGYVALDASEYRLADILTHIGASMDYVYDLGDSWLHTIKVLGINPPDQSDGRVNVLGGEWSCPPEDSNGLPTKQFREGSVNWEEAWTSRNVKKGTRDLRRFSLKEARSRTHTIFF
eukprot:comp15471_c0_seq1/m.12455 comp15471_c0_seq1/g.12455  ORF comp15471_c0_seq1/g.12455 comp15471_c0_seq1/m.12455 type:complete len:119 (-) comp15471_c0_seq1:111-467(-)